MTKTGCRGISVDRGLGLLTATWSQLRTSSHKAKSRFPPGQFRPDAVFESTNGGATDAGACRATGRVPDRRPGAIPLRGRREHTH